MIEFRERKEELVIDHFSSEWDYYIDVIHNGKNIMTIDDGVNVKQALALVYKLGYNDGVEHSEKWVSFKPGDMK